ncbi:DUF692 domain-containing protein [Mangrovimicrobium sediminis]|uniref:DUF692 domain-containing protein n=1 Tax=Mangrovimicrobium sediminis TaxID=2562682 RepID=UPI00198233D1|nr:DUF692 domain-containing protein [Haliea sp. SAOS-164]
MQFEPAVGVGLRHPHYKDALSQPPALQFVEVHAENFYMDGGPALSLLHEVRQRFDVSIHATSLGLGGEQAPPATELRRLCRLVDAIDPILVSDHACFAWHGTDGQRLHAGDLLPIAYNDHALEQFCANVDSVQQVLGRQLLVENLSAYLNWPDSTMGEFEFLQRMCERTGAGLLLDLNNIFVNAVNAGLEPQLEVIRVIASLDARHIGEVHLAGSTPQPEGDLLIDDHGTEVPEPVWRGYEQLLAVLGPKPTLVEWDTQLPTWQVLLEQAQRARRLLRERHA